MSTVFSRQAVTKWETDAGIGFFVILAVLYLVITPIAVVIRNNKENKKSGFDNSGNEKRFVNIDATAGLINNFHRQ